LTKLALGPAGTQFQTQLKAANDVNDTIRAQAVLLQAVAAKALETTKWEQQRLADLTKQTAQLGILGRMGHDIADTWRNIFGSDEIHSSQLAADLDAAKELKDVIDGIADGMKKTSLSAEQYGKSLQDILTSEKSSGIDIDETNRKIALLQSGIKGATSDIAAFVQSQ
jgi:hypothetical protein